MAETQKELLRLGTPLESQGAQRQQFGKWAEQYLRLMEAAMGGQYELLPPPNKRRRLSDEEKTSEPNARLRAALRVEEEVFRKAITKAKRQIVNTKTQEEVEVGDAVQVKIGGHWHDGHVEQVNGSDIVCKEHSSTWRAKEYWRLDERPMMKEFIQANRGDELAIFPSYQVFCNLFRQCVDKWDPPTRELVRVYHDQTKLVSGYVADEFNAATRVVQFIKATAAKVLDEVVENASQEVTTLLRAECRPYTQDERLFTELDQERLRDVQAQVKSVVHTDANGRVALREVMNAVASGVLTTKDREVVEMQVALRAYLDVAVPRFVDAIPMRLNDLILRAFTAEMTSELNSLTDDKLTRLMQDSEQKMTERQQLKEELACLASAKREIELVC
ncbi:hypothetical protein PR003_g29994 [Phytophthora rubi]|uniref:GED domain-containing protein n=3 Tax=Phytophthora rubi TaxID=129364 RepID=A0A6A4BFA1_9STRA|nr:hypothetical protein PR003_g29994 [Phytophthora rubi]